jgi:hypothetical protein
VGFKGNNKMENNKVDHTKPYCLEGNEAGQHISNMLTDKAMVFTGSFMGSFEGAPTEAGILCGMFVRPLGQPEVPPLPVMVGPGNCEILAEVIALAFAIKVAKQIEEDPMVRAASKRTAEGHPDRAVGSIAYAATKAMSSDLVKNYCMDIANAIVEQLDTNIVLREALDIEQALTTGKQ